jgi:FkbM family methyltransferase
MNLSAANRRRFASLRKTVEIGDVAAYRGARRFGRRHGVSPLVYGDAFAAKLHLLPPWIEPRAGALLDIGANEGDWTAEALTVFPGLDVIAAEPGPEPLAVLRERFAAQTNVTVCACAVSDSSGTAPYYRTRASVFASMLAPRASLEDLYPLPGGPTDVLDTIEVETVTLDELAGDRPVSVLKLDVQGGELAVLRGGERTLERTAAILTEVLFLPHYEGDATFVELHDQITRRGFQLMDLSTSFRLQEGPALWADACYARPRGDRAIRIEP